mmetsp:Transcript_11949/g.13107  ORF Transcript_11949/g.13107 Transcript_11949/m.13107 type:complete len:104 (-) Transcript_11949:976-1287(-)
MSVYSGFGTRRQETYYYQQLETLLTCMNAKLIALVQESEESFDNQWLNFFSKIFVSLRKLEENKYMPPKFSLCVRPLADTIEAEERVKNLKAQKNARISRESS